MLTALLCIQFDICSAKSLGADLEVYEAGLLDGLDAEYELTMEGFHVGLGEGFEAGGVAVADGIEYGTAGHFDADFVVGIGA